MAIKLSGLISGMDTDAMIDELVSAYSTRKDSYVKEQKALEYKQDAWKDMNTKIYSFFSGKLSSFRFSSNYSLKSTKTSNDNKVTVTGSSNAVNGTQELKITSLAKSGYLTGGVVEAAEEGKELTGSSKVSELAGFAEGSITLKANGKETTIGVTDDMTINQLVTKMKEAGVNASFDENNQRFFVSAINSGAENDFSLTGDDANGVTVLKSLGLYTVSKADITAYQDFVNAAAADADYITNLAKDDYLDSLVKGIVSELNAEKKTYTDNIAKLNEEITEAKDYKSFAGLTSDKQQEKIKEVQNKLDELNKKLAEENSKEEPAEATVKAYEDEIAALEEKMATYGKISTKAEGYTADDYEKVISEKTAEIEKINTDSIKPLDDKIKEAQGYTSATIADAETYIKNYYGYNEIDYATSATVTADDGTTSVETTAYGKILAKYNGNLDTAKDMVASYNDYQSLVAKESKTEEDLANIEALEEKLGLVQGDEGAVRITGTDAEIYLNGAKFESNTNVFQINGLTITANALTEEDEVISVTTSTDVDGIYNKVKDFFKEYNELMKSMETAYNAASAGDYEPLTDEEMEAMTDKQIEKWETKVKDAVLRRDSTLSSIVSLFKMNMSKSFEVNGENLSLASFGIKTLGYFGAEQNERGMYHIDGDADDSLVSGNADKLKEAIAEDPDKFISFFSKLTENVYTELNKKMSTSSVSSAYKVYNDKYMKQQYDRYDDKISDWEDRVDAMREKYEQQFAAMETALSQLQSQSSYFSSMLGY